MIHGQVMVVSDAVWKSVKSALSEPKMEDPLASSYEMLQQISPLLQHAKIPS